MEKENQIIKDVIKELIGKMGFICEVEISEQQEKAEEANTNIFNVKTEESNFLIGQHGVNLQSLQHIVRMLVRKKITTKSNFIVDVNSYRQEKNDSLIRLARAMADQAVQEKRAVVLRPMSPYERRIVHVELSGDDRIKTESIGEGEERKIVISPLNSF
jgi:spoIIIJ-associated protein